MKAIEKFNWRKNVRFSTYAGWWVFQRITKAIIASRKIIKTPVKEKNEVEICYIHDLDRRTPDTFINDSFENIDKFYEIEKLIEKIQMLIMLKFNERDEAVFLSRIGLDGTFQLNTFEYIGIRFGITRERVRQIVVKSLAFLKRKGILENDEILSRMIEYYYSFKHIEKKKGEEELMEHEVMIKMGPHRHPNRVPDGAQKLLEELFNCCNFTENYRFKVLLGEIVPGSGMTDKVEVRKTDGHGRSVVVVCKTGSNGTRHNYYVFRPNGYVGTLASFFYTLQEGEQKINEKEEKKEIEPVLEDLGAKSAEEKGDEIMNEKQETGDSNMPPAPPDSLSKRKKRPDAKKVFGDEVMLKAALHEIDKEENVLHKELKNRIEALGLECNSDGAINFLENEKYIKRDRRNKTISFFSLSEKGKELLGLKPPLNTEADISEKPAVISKEEDTHAIPLEDDPLASIRAAAKAMEAELEKAKENFAIAENKFNEAKRELDLATNNKQAIEKRKEEMKEKILAIFG